MFGAARGGCLAHVRGVRLLGHLDREARAVRGAVRQRERDADRPLARAVEVQLRDVDAADALREVVEPGERGQARLGLALERRGQAHDRQAHESLVVGDDERDALRTHTEVGCAEDDREPGLLVEVARVAAVEPRLAYRDGSRSGRVRLGSGGLRRRGRRRCLCGGGSGGLAAGVIRLGVVVATTGDGQRQCGDEERAEREASGRSGSSEYLDHGPSV